MLRFFFSSAEKNVCEYTNEAALDSGGLIRYTFNSDTTVFLKTSVNGCRKDEGDNYNYLVTQDIFIGLLNFYNKTVPNDRNRKNSFGMGHTKSAV